MRATATDHLPWPWPDGEKSEPAALPAIGSIAIRRVRGGVMKGTVIAHRGERIEVDFGNGDRRMIGAPFDGCEFRDPIKVAAVPHDAVAQALADLK